MNRRSPTALALALVLAGVLAGCGGSSKGTTASTAGSAPGTTSTSTTGTSSSKLSPSKNAELVALLVDGCRRAVQTQFGLSTSEKQKLAAVCTSVKKGDLAGVKKVREEVCAQLAKSTPGESKAVKESAIAICQKPK